ncbi:TIGR04372 family glycosyltransferase [Nisaea sediminum]|uniref:TIGR04372 family glycosyltransferase n=1 Tax=Nisaea sediminum TaxID=2775867 RepID=UPI001867CF5F|nr:TIGR04372 family glycosyltransferase [Nisaea sediminum]
MTTFPEDDARLLENLRAEFGKQETMQRLFQTVLPHLEEGRRTLVYILAQVDRIGHTAMEPFFVKTLYGPHYDRILLVTGEGSGAGYNPFILQCPGPEFVHVPTSDPILPLLGFLDGGILDLKLFHLCLASPQRVVRDFGRHAVAGGEIRHYELPDGIRERGEEFVAAAGMPEGAPFVMLHTRDMSYLPEKAHHAFRCADIRTYTQAIRRFTEAGYWVFRLGDSNGIPMSGVPREAVDVPRHPGYSQALDIFLSARCAFAFNQASGPEALVRAFGRPAATVNLVYELLRLPLKNDLLLFKDYVSSGDGTRLSYEEILDRGLPAVGSGEVFAEMGVEIRENGEEELEEAARIMIARDRDGTEGVPDTDALHSFRTLGLAYEQRLMSDPVMQKDNHDFYAHAHGFGVPVPSVLARKGFLDRA